MPLKCCVPKCSSNYKMSKNTVSVYKFFKSDADRNHLIAAILRANLVATKYAAVCRKHRPENYNFKTAYGKLRPVGPPSIFRQVSKRCLAATPAQERTTTKARSSARNTLSGKLKNFEKQLIVKFSEIAKDVRLDNLISCKHHEEVVIYSKTFVHGIPQLMVKIKEI